MVWCYMVSGLFQFGFWVILQSRVNVWLGIFELMCMLLLLVWIFLYWFMWFGCGFLFSMLLLQVVFGFSMCCMVEVLLIRIFLLMCQFFWLLCVYCWIVMLKMLVRCLFIVLDLLEYMSFGLSEMMVWFILCVVMLRVWVKFLKIFLLFLLKMRYELLKKVLVQFWLQCMILLGNLLILKSCCIRCEYLCIC